MAKSRKKRKITTTNRRRPEKKIAVCAPATPEPFWRSHWLPVLVVAFFAVLPYWQTLSYEYVLDDKVVFTENQFVRQGLTGIGDIFSKELFTGYFGAQKDLLVGARYRPLSLATFALEFELWGQNSILSHTGNILLYGLAGILLYAVMWVLMPGNSKQPWFLTLPFAAALLFVLHPIHSEVVANVKGRDEILALLGALGTLFISWRYVVSSHWRWLVASAVIFFLALLAKENALTFLAVVPLSLFLFASASRRDLMITTLPLLIAAVLYLLLRYSVVGYLLNPGGQTVSDVMNNPFYGLAPDERLATIFYTHGLYLKLLLFPHPLTHDYYPYQIPIAGWGDWLVIASFVIQIALLSLAIWAWRRYRILSYGVLFYFITFSIVSNVLFTVGTFMNERFVFMPSVGFCLVMAWLIVDRLPAIVGQKGRLIAVIVLVTVSLAFLTRAWIRIPDWKNAYTLNLAAAKYSPNSARANLFFGVAMYQKRYAALTGRKQKLSMLSEIDAYVNKAVQIVPAYRSAQNFRAGMSAERFNITKELGPLLAVFYDVLTYHPDVSNVHVYLDWLAGRGDPTGELAAFAHRSGFELLSQQQANYSAAIWILNYGLRAAPNNAQLRQDIALTYRAMGNEVKAREYLGE